jgi:predicted permease
MSWLSRDLGYGIRTLRKSPAFAITAIVTLALGIGASTAIFSVVNAVLLRPLPYTQADRLAIISQDLRARGVIDFPVGPGDIPDLRNGMPAFDQIAAIQTVPNATFTNKDGTPELISAATVTTNTFSVLGLPVAYGRDFAAGDGTPNQIVQLPAAAAVGAGAAGAPPAGPRPPPLPVMGILGYDFWQRKFGGDPSIVGKSITLFGGPVEVVGIASPRAELIFPVRMRVERRPDVWTALRADFENGSRINVAYRLVGRLKAGATLVQARGQSARVSADMRSRIPLDSTAGVAYHVEPMKEYLVADVRTPILALMGAVVFVLLIACANVANLMLVRAAQRERELAVRSAMGGSAWSIVRQLLSESLVLAGVAAVLGIALAEVGIKLLLRLSPDNLPRLADVTLDPRVLVFAVAVSVLSAVVFGLVPALRASRPDLAQVLRASGRTPGLGGAARLRNMVIIAEVTLSFVLLVGCGLMVRSFITLAHTDPGFDASGVLTFGITNARLRSLPEAQAFFSSVQDKLRGIPGVSAVTQSSALPLDGSDPSARWGTEAASADPSRFRQGGLFIVGSGYFETMRTHLIAGRTFNQSDNDTSDKSVIIDDAAARIAFGNQSPLGKTILARVRRDVPDQYTVVGVVQHQRHLTLFGDEKESLFFPAGAFGPGGQFIVRTSGDPARLPSAVHAAIASVNPNVLLTRVRPLTELVDDARSSTRFALVLIGIFAVIAALLAAVGLYGVLSSAVRQRTSEIGIRMAFGAQSSTIFSQILGEGLRLSAVGIGLGFVVALFATRVMQSMLVAVKPTDPLTFAAMIGFFLVVAALACWVPAHRAASLDPNAALREE